MGGTYFALIAALKKSELNDRIIEEVATKKCKQKLKLDSLFTL